METAPEQARPIFTAHLFPRLEGKLIELLRSLGSQDWEKQTLAPKWKVKDVAAHLLDTQVRKLSAARREINAATGKQISPRELLTLINFLNAEGVRRYRPLSPVELISQMQAASKESAEYHQALDPFARAMFPVSWAGEEQSENWFDTAREFTERWHHQQQIRLAVDQPGIMTREFYYPVLDCFLRALPHTYRCVPAREGTQLQFNVSGECGGSWNLMKRETAWALISSPQGKITSQTDIPQEIAWRIFTRGISRGEAEAQLRVEGNVNLALHILSMISIVG